MPKPQNSGMLILVVGPSGSGKDSLLAAASAHFTNYKNVVFPRRLITRPADAGGEAHQFVSVQQFQEMVAAHQFMLHWGAHNLWYGIPVCHEEDLAAGKTVVVNVSRSVIDEARMQYATLAASIHVDPDVLEHRLRARGRETEEDIHHRLQRATAFTVDGPGTVIIDNSADLHLSTQQFIGLITHSLCAQEQV